MLPLPTGARVAASDKLIWKRNKSVVYRKDSQTNQFTVNGAWALQVPAAALQKVAVDLYTVEAHDPTGKEKIKTTTTLHVLGGSAARSHGN